MDKKQVFTNLLKEKGIEEEWVTFFSAGEGSISPHGIENESGYLLTKSGRLFSYFFEWAGDRYDLGDNGAWSEFVKGTSDGDGMWSEFENEPEFQDAKRKLSITE